MKNKIGWFLFAALSIMIGLYPAIYFFIDRKFGLLSSKTQELLANTMWNVGFYTHILLGGLALLIGWTQFISTIRIQKPKIHIWIGKTYLIAALLSSLAGISIGFFTTGGLIPAAGFISLGIIWFYTTAMAYIHIRNKRILRHQQLMIYSFAACFAAVTLRIWLPLLTMAFGDFIIAYTIVAWLCWVPNIFVASLIVKRVAVKQER